MEPLTESREVYVGQGISTLKTDTDFEVVLSMDAAMKGATTRCCLVVLTLLPGVRVQPTPDGLLVEGGGVYTETASESVKIPTTWHPRGRPTGIYKPATFTALTATYGPKTGGRRRWTMPRKMTRRYCKKTPCRKMGFTQRASCRPWKRCSA